MSPYIKQDSRPQFKGIFDIFKELNVTTPGELNYIFTGLLMLYQDNMGENYTNHNEIVGVLECVKQEWYRKMTTPYEETKRSENGDVEVF